MKKFILSIFILLSFYTLSVAQPPAQPITEAQAVEIAKQDAIARGRSPDWFGGDVDASFEDNQWSILFIGKPDDQGMITAGDFFTVYVSPDGEVLNISPGR